MDLKSKDIDKADAPVEKGGAKAKTSRGMSLRACVAKSMTWTLEKAISPPSQEASINKTS